jgi:PAS domain S-box-containing protein
MPPRIVLANPAAARIFGYTRTELARFSGQGLVDRLHPAEKATFVQRYRDLLEGRRSNVIDRFRGLKKDGAEIWLDFFASRIVHRGRGGVQALFIDVTTRAQTEQALRDSEARYRLLMEVSPDPIVLTDLSGTIITLNLSASRLFGFDRPEDLIGKNTLDFVPAEDKPRVFEALEQTLKLGSATNVDIPLLREDGSLLTTEAAASVLYDDLHRPKYLISIGRDVSERRRAEQALRASEEKYRTLAQESVQGLIVSAGNPPRIVFANPAAARILGYAVEELLSLPPKGLWRLIPPENRRAVVEGFRLRVGGEGVPSEYETPITRRDGTPAWIWLRIANTHFEDLPAFQVSFVDVTSRKKAEQALLESEEKYRNLVEQSREGVAILQGMPPELVFANQAVATMFGYGLEEFLSLPIQDLVGTIHPDDRSDFMQVYAQHFAGEPFAPIQFRVRRKDGTWIWLERRGGVVQYEGQPAVQATILDITERKRAEEQRRESEERYRSLSEAAHDMIFIIDRDDRVVYVNRFGAAALGLEPQEVMGRPRSDFFPPEIAARQGLDIGTVLATGSAVYSENLTPLKEGQVALDTWLVPLRNESGDIISVMGISRDITQRKQMEEALRASEQRYRDTLDALNDMVHVVDPDLRILLANTALVATITELRLKCKGIIGRTPFEVFPFLPPKVAEEYAQVFRDGRTLTTEETSLIGGREVISRTTKVPIFEGDRVQRVMTIIRDVTRRRLTEEQLTRSRNELRALAGRLQEVREEERTTLSRELHDELGQALTGLRLDLASLHERIDRVHPPEERARLSERLQTMLDLVDKTIPVIRRIVTQLRPGLLDDLGLIPAIEWQLGDFKRRTSIDYGLTCASEAVDLTAEGSTAVFRILQEALTNVARHASATRVMVTMREEGGVLVMEVRDNGRGISPDELNSPDSVGLIGMRERAIVLGGEVRIAGTPGRGTLVRVEIPLRREPPDATRE